MLARSLGSSLVLAVALLVRAALSPQSAEAGDSATPQQTLGAASVTLTDAGAGLQGVYNSSVAWGDYDNDGDLDILLTGFIGPLSATRLYRNSGGANPTFADVGAGLANVQSSSVAWGDYDNDGDLDILLTGFGASGPIAKIYRNSGGANPTFSDIGAVLTDVQVSSVAWGDYDNDGDLDILLTGSDASFASVTKLFRNSGGANPTFTVFGAALDNVQQSSVAWGDYDKDGDLDILLTGFTGSARVAKLYRNSGGPSPNFSDVGAGLTGVYLSSVAWGDYDNDGDLDILLTGSTGTTNIAKLYRNSGGANPTFSDVGAGLDGVNTSSVAWGDYDNDGDLDILLTGFTGAARITKLYQSGGGANPTFSDAGAGLANVQRSSVAWGDDDNDGDLDLLLTGYDPGNIPTSRLYRNDGAPPNTPPSAPGGLTATTSSSGATFSWNAASDAQTPSAALTYNLRVGTTPGGNEISSAIAAANGYRRVVQFGNAQEQLSWTLRLSPGTYYWSVQAEDGAFAGSTFAAEQSLTVVRFFPQAVLDVWGGTTTGAWGDYDNDGDLDALQTGYFSTGYASRIYRNDGGGVFTGMATGMIGVDDGSVAWGDCDNDGDLDILISGFTGSVCVSKLYLNLGGGTFFERLTSLTGASSPSVAWGDYDNDGDLDILLTGSAAPPAQPAAPFSSIYRNEGGTVFHDVSAGLSAVYLSAAAWGDYDNDGDVDILLAGRQANSELISKVYRNDGNGLFTDVMAGLMGVQDASLAWGDYDNDGDLDILLSGESSDAGGISKIYRNDGGGTFALASPLPDAKLTSVAWGDYDNDGDLDVLGMGFFGPVVYRSSGGASPTFNGEEPGLVGPGASSVAWGDDDNDGDLDVLMTGFSPSTQSTMIYRSEGAPPNAPPGPPGNLSAVRNGSLVTFSWSPASDDHAPPAGLSYNLQVGTSPNGDQRMPAMAAANGYRRVTSLGNAQQRTSWTLAIPPGPIYWNVQAIDGAFLGSAFSGSTVAVAEAANVPAAFDLGPATPNPFTSEVAFSYALPRKDRVEIAVFDLQGRRIRVLVREERLPGMHRVRWDGRDDSGEREANGVYLVHMTASAGHWTRKLVLAR